MEFRAMESAELAVVQANIRSAFAGVVLGSGVSIRQAVVLDNYGEGCTSQEFTALPLGEITDDWERVPDTELERAFVSYFDPQGFRYYIPALALSVLRNYDSGSSRVIGTISSLYPKQQNWSHCVRKYELMNEWQKFAVALFLSHLPSLVSLNHEDATCVSRALRNYWSQFLERPSNL
jgi:hypothetical protein